MRTLLVEDDNLIGSGVEAGLRQAAFTVDGARDGRDAQLALGTTKYALVVLDLGLSKGSVRLMVRRQGSGGRDKAILSSSSLHPTAASPIT